MENGSEVGNYAGMDRTGVRRSENFVSDGAESCISYVVHRRRWGDAFKGTVPRHDRGRRCTGGFAATNDALPCAEDI